MFSSRTNHTTGTRRQRRGLRGATAMLAACLLIASCSDSDDDSATSDDTSTEATSQTLGRSSASGGQVSSDGSSGHVDSEDEASGGLVSDDAASATFDRALDEDTQDALSTTIPAEAPERIDRPERDTPQEPENTTFRDYGVNPFTDTSDDALSTFALDVDTASFTLARQWLDEGLLPDPASVRVEEFINFYDQDYRPPRDDTFAVYADGAPHPFIDDDTYLLRIGIAAEQISDRARDDANITLVVDVSGSMNSGAKLETVKGAFHVLVDELDGDDRVAIVAYNQDAWVVLDPTWVNDAETIHRSIDRLAAGGNTNAEAGLALGYDVANNMFGRNDTNRVLLASDGVANVGNTSAGGILERISEDSTRGIGLVAVGVGIEDYNDVLLEQLANQGNGIYAYVDSQDEAERLFARELVGTLQTVAEDAKVQVEFDDRNLVAYRLIGFENRDIADQDFRDDSVDAGEVGSGHTVTALYEVELARGVVPGDGERLATVNLRWNEPGGRRAQEIDGLITTDLISRDHRDASARFRLTATVATFAEILRDSRYVRGLEPSDLLEEAVEVADLLGRDGDVQDLIGLIDSADRLSRRR